MINRYQGNSGRRSRYDEPGDAQRSATQRQNAQQPRQGQPSQQPPKPPQRQQSDQKNRQSQSGNRQPHRQQPERSQPARPQNRQPGAPLTKNQTGGQQGLLSSLEGLSRLLPERIGELETEDVILLLILYLMYRESGDSELLIIMGGMFLL